MFNSFMVFGVGFSTSNGLGIGWSLIRLSSRCKSSSSNEESSEYWTTRVALGSGSSATRLSVSLRGGTNLFNIVT